MGKINNILFQEVSQIIEEGKKQVVTQVNTTLTLVYWQVGFRINADILNNERATYGKEIVSQLAKALSEKYGRSFGVSNLRRMMQFADVFADFQIVAPVARQLSWYCFIILMPINRIVERT